MKNLSSFSFRLLSTTILLIALFAQTPQRASAQTETLKAKMDRLAQIEEPKVIAWRRDIHEHPELSNREVRTSELIAKHLQSLGLEVQTGIAKTGVVGILRGGKPGPVIALRADMDALPVTERVNIPFASKVITDYNGGKTGVMHACGHDSHVAILMGTAEVLSQVKSELAGTIKFIFQPAEEGAPAGEVGGASIMVKEGVMENPKVEAIFGLHIGAQTPVGTIDYHSGGTMASSDGLSIVVKGKQSHGANPWLGIDPIVTSALIITNLQTIVSRMTPLTETPAVVTIGSINGGNRGNIIPEEVKMTGTIRCFDTKVQLKIHEQIRRIAKSVAESQGATAEVNISINNPVLYNDPALVAKMLPSIQEVTGADHCHNALAQTGAEDFAHYGKVAPSFFFFLGGLPKGTKVEDSAPHHTPDFYIDESGFILGVKTFCHMVVDYAQKK